MENVEETEYYNTANKSIGNQHNCTSDGPPGAAPLRNKVDNFLGKGQSKKGRLREDAEEGNEATPRKRRR